MTTHAVKENSIRDRVGPGKSPHSSSTWSAAQSWAHRTISSKHVFRHRRKGENALWSQSDQEHQQHIRSHAERHDP